MYFDALCMACMADELRQQLLGGRIQQVLIPDKLSVGLEIYAQHERYYLVASAHAELGRVLMVSEKLRRGERRTWRWTIPGAARCDASAARRPVS